MSVKSELSALSLSMEKDQDQATVSPSPEVLPHEDQVGHSNLDEQGGESDAVTGDAVLPVSPTTNATKVEEELGSNLSCVGDKCRDDVCTNEVNSAVDAEGCFEISQGDDVVTGNDAEANAETEAAAAGLESSDGCPAAGDGGAQAMENPASSAGSQNGEVLSDNKERPASTNATSRKRKKPLPKPPQLLSTALHSTTLPALKSHVTPVQTTRGGRLPFAGRREKHKSRTTCGAAGRQKVVGEGPPPTELPTHECVAHQSPAQDLGVLYDDLGATPRRQRLLEGANYVSDVELRLRRKKDEERRCCEMLRIARLGKEAAFPNSPSLAPSDGDRPRSNWVPSSRGLSHLTSMSCVQPCAVRPKESAAKEGEESTPSQPSRQKQRRRPMQQAKTGTLVPPLHLRCQQDVIQRCLDLLLDHQKNHDNHGSATPNLGYSYTCILSGKGLRSASETLSSCRTNRSVPSRSPRCRTGEGTDKRDKQLERVYTESSARSKLSLSGSDV